MFHIILWLDGAHVQFHINITNCVMHNMGLEFLHGRQKMILAVSDNIRLVMAIKVQPLSVRYVSEPFSMHPVVCCAQ